MNKGICIECGKEISNTKRKDSIYCCNKCAMKYRGKKHYQQNKKNYLTQAKSWNESNPEKIKNIQKKYRHKNPLKCRLWDYENRLKKGVSFDVK